MVHYYVSIIFKCFLNFFLNFLWNLITFIFDDFPQKKNNLHFYVIGNFRVSELSQKI